LGKCLIVQLVPIREGCQRFISHERYSDGPQPSARSLSGLLRCYKRLQVTAVARQRIECLGGQRGVTCGRYNAVGLGTIRHGDHAQRS
jgi:hypothetical protein